jgi:hypothetical protein
VVVAKQPITLCRCRSQNNVLFQNLKTSSFFHSFFANYFQRLRRSSQKRLDVSRMVVTLSLSGATLLHFAQHCQFCPTCCENARVNLTPIESTFLADEVTELRDALSLQTAEP